MKYLLYTLEYPPQIGGVADYYYNLVLSWPKESTILVNDISRKRKINKLRFFYWPKLVKKLIQEIKQEKINYVIIGHILPLGAIVYLASFFHNFSYAPCFHGLDYSCAKAKKYKKLLTYLILKKAKKIICANSLVALSIEKDFPGFKNKIIISNPGARVSTCDEKLVKQIKIKYNLVDKKIIFSLGRLIERKGFDNMIKALAILKKENFNLFNKIVYLIAGNGPDLKRLKKISHDYKVSDKIIFLTEISQEKKFALYNLCQFFAMPARQIMHDYEGFGIVYLEANLFKKPVIAGNSGGVPDAVVDNLNGFLVDPNNINLIKASIEQLLINDNLAKKLGENGYFRAKNNFNWTSLAKKLKENL
jgi:phosphatidyl-myo-inositol dimannoside synthase